MNLDHLVPLLARYITEMKSLRGTKQNTWSVSHLAVLMVIYQRHRSGGDPLKMREIADRAGLSSVNMTDTIDTIEKIGWCKRWRSKPSAREVQPLITPEGVAAAKRILGGKEAL
jgi:DNA-binding MarR family transcriptional regulator